MLERTTMSGRLLMMPSPPVGAVAMLLDLAEMQGARFLKLSAGASHVESHADSEVGGSRGIRVLLPCARD